jgi:hypothetical protein
VVYANEGPDRRLEACPYCGPLRLGAVAFTHWMKIDLLLLSRSTNGRARGRAHVEPLCARKETGNELPNRVGRDSRNWWCWSGRQCDTREKPWARMMCFSGFDMGNLQPVLAVFRSLLLYNVLKKCASTSIKELQLQYKKKSCGLSYHLVSKQLA